MIAKDVNERDARVSLVKITPAGEVLFNNATTTLNARSEVLLKNLDHKGADKFLALLQSI